MSSQKLSESQSPMLRRAAAEGLHFARIPTERLGHRWPATLPRKLGLPQTARVLLSVLHHGDWIRAFEEAEVRPSLSPTVLFVWLFLTDRYVFFPVGPFHRALQEPVVRQREKEPLTKDKLGLKLAMLLSSMS